MEWSDTPLFIRTSDSIPGAIASPWSVCYHHNVLPSFLPHAYNKRKIAEIVVMKFDTGVFTEEPSGDLDFLSNGTVVMVNLHEKVRY